jgi:hypothetical protein
MNQDIKRIVHTELIVLTKIHLNVFRSYLTLHNHLVFLNLR